MKTLFVNWFDHPNPARAAEFDKCLKRNFQVFERVVVLKGRPTFQDFFREFAPGINIIANLDIYFDETIELANPDSLEVYALTRHEELPDGRIVTFADRHYGHPGEYSQDAWIFGEKPDIFADFCIGQRGCDNHLAYLLHEAGYRVTNPSMDIRAIHLHNIEPDASHDRGDRVGNGKYLPVKPSKL
jgi:hypothetical protein